MHTRVVQMFKLMFKLMVGGFYFECECVGWDVCERERGESF